jgi:Protein of unknown function (DUF3300)
MIRTRTYSDYQIGGHQIGRQALALALSIVLIPFASGNLSAQGVYNPYDAGALDQMVAPIALYPDALVAQILTASTYPQQVSDAANWSRQNAALPPQERANIANGMPWDPSIKALTAFPNVLDDLARNYNWMASLGNAYYNQPGDIMNAIQAARFQAQQAGYLRSTPQERVYYSGGQILIAPVNPSLVYVPYYNPWRIYGGWVSPYPGYYVAPPPRGFAVRAGIGFFAGVSIGLFAGFAWGYHHWEPNWRGGVVEYNHDRYISRSDSVYNHGHFGEHNRGVFEQGGRGVPQNFHPPVTRATANFGREGNPGARPGAVRPEAVRPGIGRTQVERNQVQPNRVQRNQVERNQFERGQAPREQVARPQAPRPEAPRAQAPRPQNFSRPQNRVEGGNRPQVHAAPSHTEQHAAPAHAAPHEAQRGGHGSEHGGDHSHK